MSASDALLALRRALQARAARGMASEFIEAREAAVLLHVHRYTIYRWIHAGELPAARVGRKLLIPVSAIERLLEEATEAVSME